MVVTGLSADVVGLAPTLTWPSHAMIATGVPPDQNGILDNQKPGKPDERYWNESDLKAPPIWQAAHQKGLRTAAIYWPSTVAPCQFQLSRVLGRTAGDFDRVRPGQRKVYARLIDRVAKWDNSFVAPLWDDTTGIDVMRFLLTNEKLDLILLHLPELDAEEHDTGALSIYSRKVLENDDELLGFALQKMAPGTAVAITSDHGFDTESYVVRPKVMLKAASLSDAVSVKYGLIGTASPKAAALLRKSIGSASVGNRARGSACGGAQAGAGSARVGGGLRHADRLHRK